MRTLTRVGVVAAASTAALLFSGPGAFAANGDNGDVKVHQSTTDENDQRDETHVCSFYLDGFNFDGLQQVDWHIEVWAPTDDVKGETVKTGSITLDGNGHGRTQDLSLPDGHYKLFWNFDGENGRAKHKVFWSKCEEEGGTGGTTSPSPSSSESSTASPSASESASPTPSGSSTVGATAAPSEQGGSGDLAETGNGAPVGLLSAVAAALVAGGGFLVFRRRKGQHS